jgi:hypothetical protein
LSRTPGKAYLYNSLRGKRVNILTETIVPRTRQGNILAANTNLAHITARITKLPYLAVEDIFTVNNITIHDCVVDIRGHRFLFSGHYSRTAPVNGALKELAPGFDWRGELNVVALGRKIPYLQRMKCSLVIAAINKCVSDTICVYKLFTHL